MSVFCHYNSGYCVLCPAGLWWQAGVQLFKPGLSWSFTSLCISTLSGKCLESEVHICRPIAIHKVVSTLPESWGHFQSCSQPPERQEVFQEYFPRAQYTVNYHAPRSVTCTVSWNANLASLLCFHSDPWRNAVVKSVQIWCYTFSISALQGRAHPSYSVLLTGKACCPSAPKPTTQGIGTQGWAPGLQLLSAAQNVGSSCSA